MTILLIIYDNIEKLCMYNNNILDEHLGYSYLITMTKTYDVAEVMRHFLPIPSEADDLTFLIRWEGYPDSKDFTYEHWATNKSIRINSVVLLYMENLSHLKQYVPTNVILHPCARMEGTSR